MDLMKFLCMLWDYGANQGDQLDVRVGAVLQTQALYVGQAVLAALPASTLPALASNRSPGTPRSPGHRCIDGWTRWDLNKLYILGNGPLFEDE